MPARLMLPTSYADVIRNTPGLIGYWRLGDTSGTTLRDELNLANGTYAGSPSLGQGTPIRDGRGFKTNGTTQYATIAENLSAYAVLSLSFWLYWDAYGAGDNMAMEYTPNTNNVHGFYIDPNAGNGRFQVDVGLDATHAWVDSFTRPSAAAWHHYLITMDRATPVTVAHVDGVSQSLTTDLHSAGTYGNWANDTLYLMSRGGTSLFGAGRMTELGMYSRILTNNEARTHYYAGVS